MHSKERQQLVEFYSREARRSLAPPERGSNRVRIPSSLMLKCAACVAVVTLLVVISNGEYKAGIAVDGRSDPVRQATVQMSSRAAADRKEVFDARRASFESHEAIPGRRIAAAAVTPDSARLSKAWVARPAQAASTAEWMPAAANATDRCRLPR